MKEGGVALHPQKVGSEHLRGQDRALPVREASGVHLVDEVAGLSDLLSDGSDRPLQDVRSVAHGREEKLNQQPAS
jgi:hypothetical protein